MAAVKNSEVFTHSWFFDCKVSMVAIHVLPGKGFSTVLDFDLVSRSGLPRSADRVGKRDVLFEGEARVSHPADSI